MKPISVIVAQEQQIPVDRLQLSPDDSGRVSGTMRHNPDTAVFGISAVSIFKTKRDTIFS
jgi:hypothetical protein